MPIYLQRAEAFAEKWGVEAPKDFIEDMANEMRSVADRALNFDVVARLANLLLELTVDSLTPTPCVHGNPKGFDIRMSQNDMARAVGASRSYVSTLINEWKYDRILSAVGRTTCVLDIKKLRKMAAQRRCEV